MMLWMLCGSGHQHVTRTLRIDSLLDEFAALIASSES
jgi:hypothetical protein